MNFNQLKWAHPLIARWFKAKFGEPTEPQTQSWPFILAKQNTLISAPTGSGKTLAAFLTCIDSLLKKSIQNTLPASTEIIYISPLKALSNDIHKNLCGPLDEIKKMADESNIVFNDIRIAVRTGDTLNKERQSMLKNPPHILITTPESFYILLTAEKSREMLKNVKTVIVDEIHALVNTKRGAHLALSLERLEALTQNNLLRIGLSATQKPIELVGKFLVGNNRPLPKLINIGHARQLDLTIEVPCSELSSVASNEMWDEIYKRIADLSSQNRSILVFVNTRRLAERVAHHLGEKLGEENVLAHHGSLSRKIRLSAEEKLKQGKLKILVATASLELGIDIGEIDLVCQIGSPRAIAVALQRVGRSGHWHTAISHGKFFVTTRDELVECAALIKAIKEGDLDQLTIPTEPLDILAQQIVAITATEAWNIDDLFNLITLAYPYHSLSKETYMSVIQMLSFGISGLRNRYGTYLSYDQVNNIVKGRRNAKLTAIMNGGAIPDNALFTVIAEPHGVMVGTLDEDFAVESHRGDIILLGTTSWRIRRIEAKIGKVYVEDAHGAPPNVPFWRGEAPARTDELSLSVSNFRQTVIDLLSISKEHTQQWLEKNGGVDKTGGEQIIDYLIEAKKVLGEIPTQQRIIAERFFDESGGMQLVIHAPFGSRINKAWGLALRKKFCQSFNFELQASATDNGINISLSEQHSFPLADVFHFLHPNTLKDTLIQTILQIPLFTTHWRWVALRSLALPKYRGGKKIPPNILRMLAEDLLSAVFPDAAACQDNLAGKKITPPDHPLINETLQEILTETLDLPGLLKIISDIVSHQIEYLAVDSPTPSVFSHELLNANPYAYLDDAPLEERRARAVEMRRFLPDSVLREIGKLDPKILHHIQTTLWPDIRNEDELHDFLQTVVVLPVENSVNWEEFIEKLLVKGRAGIATYHHKKFLFPTEKLTTFLTVYPNANIEQQLKKIETIIPTKEHAITEIVHGWLLHLGPTSSHALSHKLSIEINAIEQALYLLEQKGIILRGKFISDDEEEWCERRILARIHKETMGQLRKEIEPVTSAQFIRWLLSWQHILPNHQLEGERGLFEIVKQLQGLEIPANAWEKQIFAKRLIDYHGALLDKLCISGIIGWGRISSPFKDAQDIYPIKRIIPTSTAPITFFIRSESETVLYDTQELNIDLLSYIAKDIYLYLKKYGASFFTDIVKGVDHLKSEVETGLWELVTAGLITADGFDNLRSLIDRRRRIGRRSGRHIVKTYSTGRWVVLHKNTSMDQNEYLENVCGILLNRYGVVFRDLISREKNLPKWRELLMTFRRLEDQGKIRGGRFVEGFHGEQFALHHALSSLRTSKKTAFAAIDLTISSVDPLNLQGIILPGERLPSVSGKNVQLKLDKS